MTLRVIPEGLTAASAAVEALTARLAAAHAGAAPLVTAVIPPAADPVSLQTAVGMSAPDNPSPRARSISMTADGTSSSDNIATPFNRSGAWLQNCWSQRL